jgi:D-glycero-D-manno-heptose 1,7-bisphosphate phosphatase
MGIREIVRQAVFLDRDGVINRAIVREGKPYPPSGLAELEILPGVPEALSRLQTAGLRLIVVTNQPDVARGRQTWEDVQALHAALQAQLPLDEFRVCCHDDADRCVCRKPAPGMLLAAAQEHNLDLSTSFMVGDRWRDVEAGRRAGCSTVFIDYGYAEPLESPPHVRVRSLAEATDWILAHITAEGR